MTIYAGITFYEPEQSSVDYVLLLSNLFDRVIIFDNSEVKNTDLDQLFSNKEKYIYINNGKNLGLSIAYNTMIRYSLDNKSQYLMLFDQDSCFNITKVKNFLNDIRKLDENQKTNVMIYAMRTYFFDSELKLIDQNGEYENTQFAITSGSCINIPLLAQAKIFYDENIFIDHLDYDFCSRVIKQNYKIMLCNKYCVKQQLGYKVKNKICYSPIRFYYFTRDKLYLNKRNHTFPIYIYYNCKTIAYIIFKKILLNEDKKIIKFKYFIKGFKDYLKKKTGCYS